MRLLPHCNVLVVSCRDHRNESLRDWLINDHVLGATNGLGNENVSGMITNALYCIIVLVHTLRTLCVCQVIHQ